MGKNRNQESSRGIQGKKSIKNRIIQIKLRESFLDENQKISIIVWW